MSLICCGGLRTDFVITTEGQARLMQMGGNAIYSAAGAHLWLDDVAILGRAGDNFPSEWIAELAARGFDVRGICNIGGVQDHRTFYAYVDRDTRIDTDPATHFARIGVPLPEPLRGYVNSTPGQDDPDHYEPLATRPEDLDELLAARAEQSTTTLHIAPTSIRTQRFLPESARRRGLGLVSLDPGERTMLPRLRAHIEEVLGRIDVFLPSDQEVRSLFESDPVLTQPHEAARWFAARGPRVVVIKLGSQGVLVFEREAGSAGPGIWRLPALPATVVDVTGAGDAFCGGFMASFGAHGDPIAAAIAGSVSASFAIEHYGAAGLLNASRSEAESRSRSLLGAAQRIT